MIDAENAIFTKVATALRSAYSGILVQGRTTFAPSSFPCVCIEEADSYSYRKTRDTGSNENHVQVMYEVNVFSNKEAGAKGECKQIFSTIDGIMNGLGFTRTSKIPVAMDDATKYRLNGRYQAVIGTDHTIYRR